MAMAESDSTVSWPWLSQTPHMVIGQYDSRETGRFFVMTFGIVSQKYYMGDHGILELCKHHVLASIIEVKHINLVG